MVGAPKAAVSLRASNPTGARRRRAQGGETLDQTRTVSVTPGTPWAHGGEVVVRAEYPYEINLIGLVLASGRLKSETVERVE